MSNKLLSIVCLSCLPFIFTLHGDFVFDDSEAIVKNKDVTSTSWTEPFFNDFWGTDIKSHLSHKSYRPLTILSFRLNYLWNKRSLEALQFKITNLICHSICCVLLWKSIEIILNVKNIHTSANQDTGASSKLGSRCDGKIQMWWTDTAYLSALLFAVHPIHTEAVCGIVGRADILAAITFFLAFICYNKSVSSEKCKYIYLLLTVIIAGISMLFKENGITVLGFCLVYEVVTKYKVKRKDSPPLLTINMGSHVIRMTLDSILRVVTITTAAIGLLYCRWVIMGGTAPEFKPTDNPAAFSHSIFTKIATYNYIYFLNLVLLVWPQWLCYDWSMGCVPLIGKLPDFRTVPVLLMYFYAILLVRSMIGGKRKKSANRLLILAVSLTLIPFLPAANIFYPVGFVIAERILYIPSAGYCLLIVIGFNRLLHKKSLAMCKVGVFMFLLLLLLYALRSWERSIDWQSEYNLFVNGLLVCPLNAKVHYNVAKVADANHETTWALTEYKKAIKLYPEYYQAMNNAANLLKNQKEFAHAEMFLRAAITYKPDFPAAWMNLGIVLASVGQYSESKVAYRTAIGYRRKYPDCYYNLGNLYLEINRTDDAMNSWFEAVHQNPKHVLAWTNLLALLDNTGQIQKALKLIPKVLTELPDAPSINFAIANMYGKLNRYGEAENHFKKAIRLFDKEVQAIHYANLGVLYHRWKKYDLAAEMYESALQIDPAFKTAYENLETLQKNKH